MEVPVNPGTCDHLNTQLTCRPDRNGNKRYQRQCVVCSQPVGSWISKSKAAREMRLDAIPTFDKQAMQAAWDNLKDLDMAQVDYELPRMRLTYEEYLRSPAWLKKRDLVIKRAGGICEGCGAAQPSQVHHFSYENLGNEFLWELAAVCSNCHDRAHPWKLDDQRPSAKIRRERLHRELERSALFKNWIAAREQG